MITTPLRRRWPSIVADARRWNNSILQFLQRAPARLRQNESTSHGLTRTLSYNGRVAYHMRVTQTFEDSQPKLLLHATVSVVKNGTLPDVACVRGCCWCRPQKFRPWWECEPVPPQIFHH
jgi:hypothetical protein